MQYIKDIISMLTDTVKELDKIVDSGNIIAFIKDIFLSLFILVILYWLYSQLICYFVVVFDVNNIISFFVNITTHYSIVFYSVCVFSFWKLVFKYIVCFCNFIKVHCNHLKYLCLV